MFHTCKQDSAEKFKNHRELKRKKFIESLSILSFKINKPVYFCAVLKCSVIHSDSMIPWTLQALCPSNSPGKNTGVGLPFPTPEDLPHPETEPTSLAPPALAGSFFTITPPAAAAKSLQSSPTLCDPIDGSPPGSSVPGILQARILEWVAISFSSALGSPKFLYQSYFFYAYSFFYDSMTCFSHQVIYAEYFPISLMSYRKSFSHHLGCYQVLMIMHSSVLNTLNIYVCSA